MQFSNSFIVSLPPDKAWEAFIQNHNVAIRRGSEVRVLSTDGTADFAYQLGSIQWAKDSASLTAYKVHADVWRAASLSGSVRKLVQRTAFTVGH